MGWESTDMRSGQIVKSASLAKDVELDNSNQSSEGNIRWLKNDPAFKIQRKEIAM